MTTSFEVTDIQLFKHEAPVQTTEDGDFEIEVSYSANIAINDSFMIQCSGDDDEATYSFPYAEEAAWNSSEAQDSARELFSLSEITESIEKNGFENNIGWLEENGELIK